MLIISSPAKTFASQTTTIEPLGTPCFPVYFQKILSFLQTKSQHELQNILQVSPALAARNFDRYQCWNQTAPTPALFGYRGDVFAQLPVDTYTSIQRNYAHSALRIITGLYGVVRGMDAIQPYRLEMKLTLDGFGKLSDFWRNTITDSLYKDVTAAEHAAILNCASHEYAAAVHWSAMPVPVITVEFRVERDGQLKNFGLLAKKARGKMIDFCIQNQIKSITDIQYFQADGYRFNQEMSTDDQYFFVQKVDK